MLLVHIQTFINYSSASTELTSGAQLYLRCCSRATINRLQGSQNTDKCDRIPS